MTNDERDERICACGISGAIRRVGYHDVHRQIGRRGLSEKSRAGYGRIAQQMKDHGLGPGWQSD